MPDQESLVSDTVLDTMPGRTLTFLRGIAMNPVIHAQLAAVGFDTEENQLGWALLHEAAGYTPTPPPPPTRSAAFNAMETLDAWDENGLRRVRAALERLHPEQSTFVFADGLAAQAGPAAVVGVKKLLDRLDDLDNGKDRKATRKEDQAALKTLSTRGITKEERARLRALVDSAQTVDAPATPALPMGAAARQAALLKLHAWYKDWAQTAHSVIAKRAHLISLGLAKRKAAKKTAKPE